VRKVASWVGSRAKALLIVCAGFILVLVVVMLLVLPTALGQVEQLLRDLPTLIIGFEHSDLFVLITSTYGNEVEQLLNEIQAFVTNPSNIVAIGGGVLQAGVTLINGVSGFVIVLVLTLYFIATLPTMKEAFVRLAPARTRTKVASMTDEIMASVGHYLNGMVILALFNAVFTFVLHLLLGLPFPQLMAVLAFCITLIPLVGSLLFWGTATVLALFTNPTSALIFLVVYFIYMQLEAYLFTPRVMNRSVAVPGSLVVIGAMVGGTLLGLLGALVAIPVTTSILLIVKQVIIPRQDAKT